MTRIVVDKERRLVQLEDVTEGPRAIIAVDLVGLRFILERMPVDDLFTSDLWPVEAELAALAEVPT